MKGLYKCLLESGNPSQSPVVWSWRGLYVVTYVLDYAIHKASESSSFFFFVKKYDIHIKPKSYKFELLRELFV